MGVDAGFDMVPRLSMGQDDQQKWQMFITLVETTYQNDNVVEKTPNCIIFKAGEHPRLPLEGYKFLRFSSKISGRYAQGVEEYIMSVMSIARLFFGSRIRFWDETFDQRGYYNWQVVHDSIRSYEQIKINDGTAISTSIEHPAASPPAGSDTKSFDVLSSPGKGRGLFARFRIPKGECILFEHPFFTISSTLQPMILEHQVAAKLRELSKNQQREFLALHNNFPGKQAFSGIVRTNALPCGSGSPIGAVYPTISLINHSCLPNAHNSWNDTEKCEYIYATREIEVGEEITISYDHGGPSDTRHAHLKHAFGFDCDCVICSKPLAELEASDCRRRQIQHLDQLIGDPSRVMSDPSSCLTDCHRLLQLLDEEYQGGAGALIPRLYYDAFQIAIAHGDEARATIFAERAYKSRALCEGDDNPITQKMKHLMERPSSHGNFGASNRWKSSKKLIPTDLEDHRFEEWLWRKKGLAK